MGITAPGPGSSPNRQTRRRSLAWPYRLGILLLLLAMLLIIWRPVEPSAEAVAVGERYLAENYSGYVFSAPRAGRWPLNDSSLTFDTVHQGEVARVVLELRRTGGELVVAKSTLVIGRLEADRLASWLLSLAALFAVIYLVFFVSIPQTFGRKCPRDLKLLRVTERIVVHGTIHTSGLGLAPIVERVYACPICDFHHHEAFPDPTYRPSMPTLGIGSGRAFFYLRGLDGMIRASEERRTQNAITDEQYAQLLADAKRAARERSSPDSPWLDR